MSKTRQSKKAIRQCDGCGRIHFCEDHHPAKRENNSEITFPVGIDEHRRYLTPRQNHTGLTAGLGKTSSTLAGTSQALISVCQQASEPDLANIFQKFAVPVDRTKRLWTRPDRIAKPVDDTDSLVFVQRYCKRLSDITVTAMNDPACPGVLQPVLGTLWRFADTAQNRPLSLLQWAESSGSQWHDVIGDHLQVATHESAIQAAEHALDDFRAVESMALDFLRYEHNRKTDSEPAMTTA